MQDSSPINENKPPVEGQRPQNFAHIYAGSFKDTRPDLRPAGILTYAPGENVELVLRQSANSAPSRIAPNVPKFRHYSGPDVGETRLHYGHANDPKIYEQITHGVRTDQINTTKDCINPMVQNRFSFLKGEMKERLYASNKSAPLGRVPKGNLPETIDPFTTTFGMKTNKFESVKETINPNKPRFLVELETSDKHDMYVFSHKDYEPGEQKDRLYTDTFDRYKRFGWTTDVFHDGRKTKEALNWLPTKLLDRRMQSESHLLDDFREKHTPQIGKKIDPNQDTRFVGPDHVFGLTNTGDQFSSGDIVHGRSDSRIMKGKDKERAYVAVLRSHLARYNFVKFNSLVDAFKFYDKDKDGLINKEDLNFICAYSGFPAADDLLNLLIRDCDRDNDGKINFLEFSNFLCFKDSMKTGLEHKPTNDPESDVKDSEGRVLLKEKDLVPKHNIPVNELVPRTISNQIDEKASSWKTSYDVINDAAFRPEPFKKRVYGVPTVRNDLPAPDLKKIADRTNYGTDGTAWSLISPNIYSKHGVYERDVLQPRSKFEIKKILRNVGYDIPDEVFEKTWNTAQNLSPHGGVSIEQFRSALGEFERRPIQNTELACN